MDSIDDFTHPITPFTVTNKQIVTYNKPHSTWQAPFLQHVALPIHLQSTHARTSSVNINKKRLIIGIHKTILYDRHTYTWTLAQNTQHILHNGTIRTFQSRTCSSIRGGFIGVLEAATYAIEALHQQHQTPNATTLIICSRDKKMLRAINMERHTKQCTSQMLAPEKSVLQVLFPVLQKFQTFKTHLSSKSDREGSTEKLAIDTSVARIQNCTNILPTTYIPTGRATIWMNKQEVSADIDANIRIAANSTELHRYLQRKYEWSDSTIANIVWMLLGKSLRALSNTQRKTITQFMHEF
jgi:hypothetical protein